MGQASAPNFCPPEQEGTVITFADEQGDTVDLEFLGLILLEEARFGFFFPVTQESPALSSGSVVVLEVTDLDEDGQPVSFEMVDDEAVAQRAYEAFAQASVGMYDFE